MEGNNLDISMITKLKSISFGIGFIFTLFFLLIPPIAAFFATEIAIGCGIFLANFLFLFYIFLSPVRIQNEILSSIHSFIFGVLTYWFFFNVCFIDLHNRNDILWVLTLIIPGVIILIKIFSHHIVKLLLDIYLSYYPDGELLISFFQNLYEIEDNNLSSENHRCEPSLKGEAIHKNILFVKKYKLFNIYSVFHNFWGLPIARSFPAETAIKDSLDSLVHILTKDLKRNILNPSHLNRCLKAFKLEIDYYLLVFKKFGINFEDNEKFQSRILMFWGLLMLYQRIFGDEIIIFINEYLKIISSIFFENQTGNYVCKLYENKTDYQRTIKIVNTIAKSKLSKKKGDNKNSDNILLVIFCDYLIFKNLSHIVLAVLGILDKKDLPLYMKNSIERLIAFSQKEMLMHEKALMVANASVYKSQSNIFTKEIGFSRLLNENDSNNFIEAIKDNSKIKWKSLFFIKSILEQKGINLGFDTILTTIIFVFVIGFGLFCYFYLIPLGETQKTVKDIFRSSKYNNTIISSADFDKKNSNIIIGTNGGGIHQLNTNTFRLTTETKENGLSSNWIDKVAVASDSSMFAMVREEFRDKLLKATNPSEWSGLNFRDANYNWKTLISPNGVTDIDGKEIKTIIKVGKNRIIAVDNKLLLYDIDLRKLTEINIINKSTFDYFKNEKIHYFLSDLHQNKYLYVLTKYENANSYARLLRLTFENDLSNCIINDISHPDIKNTIAEAEFINNEIYVRTTDSNLYKLDIHGWTFLYSIGHSIEVSKIVNIFVGSNNNPSLWCVFKSDNGKYYMQMCNINNKRLMPDSPWVGIELNTNKGSELSLEDFKFNPNKPEPFIYWSEQNNSNKMLVLGNNGSLFVISSPKFPINGKELQNLKVDKLLSSDEKVLWFDADKDNIYILLDKISEKTRYLFRYVWNKDNHIEFKQCISSNYYGNLLKNNNILCFVSRNDGFIALTSKGKLLEFSNKLLGWKNTSDIVLKDHKNRIINEIISASYNNRNSISFIDKDNQLYEVILPENLSKSKELICNPLQLNPNNNPDASLEIKLVATEPDGTVFFFSDKNNRTYSWCLNKQVFNNSLIRWQKDSLPDNESIRLNSLIRIQYANKVGKIIALSNLGYLIYRDNGRWIKVGNEKWDKIINVEGATFVSDNNKILLLKNYNSIPTLDKSLWQANNNELEQTIDKFGFWNSSNENIYLVFPNKNNLKMYNPNDNTWKTINTGFSNNKYWDFWQFDNNKILWCVKKTGSNLEYCILNNKNITIHSYDKVEKYYPFNEGIILIANDKSVVYIDSYNNKKILVSGIRDNIGDGEIIKVEKLDSNRLIMLASNGCLFFFKGIESELTRINYNGFLSIWGKITDFTVDSNNAIYAIDEKGGLFKSDNDSYDSFSKISSGFNLVDSVNNLVFSANTSKGILNVIKNDRTIEIATNKSEYPSFLNPISWFANGNNLYLSSHNGCVVHNERNNKFNSISDGNNITRFENIGNKIIGWKGAKPYLLDNGFLRGDYFKPISNALNLFELENNQLGYIDNSGFIYKYNGGNNDEKQNFFFSNANLEKGVAEAVPINSFMVGLRTKSGEMLLYNIRNRNYFKIELNKELGKNWNFYNIENRIFLVSNNYNLKKVIYKFNLTNKSISYVSSFIGNIRLKEDYIFWKQNSDSIAIMQKLSDKVNIIIKEKDLTEFIDFIDNYYLEKIDFVRSSLQGFEKLAGIYPSFYKFVDQTLRDMKIINNTLIKILIHIIFNSDVYNYRYQPIKSFYCSRFQFRNKEDDCEIILDNQIIDTTKSRLECDEIIDAVTLRNNNSYDLYSLTKMPNFIIKEEYGVYLGKPYLIELPLKGQNPVLRVRNNTLYAVYGNSFSYKYENGNWKKSDIDWSINNKSSYWSITADKKLAIDGVEQELLYVDGKVCIDSETFSSEVTSDGNAMVTSVNGLLAYKSLAGNWYTFNYFNNQRLKIKEQFIKNKRIIDDYSGINIANRCKTGYTYWFEDSLNNRISPFFSTKINKGRLAHEDTTGEIIRVDKMLYLPLNSNNSFRYFSGLFDLKYINANTKFDTGNDKYLILDYYNYKDLYTLSWKRNDTKFTFYLNKNNNEINLGNITYNGFDFYSPNNISILRYRKGICDFIFNNQFLTCTDYNINLSSLNLLKEFVNIQPQNCYTALINSEIKLATDGKNYNRLENQSNRLGFFNDDGMLLKEKSTNLNISKNSSTEYIGTISNNSENINLAIYKNGKFYYCSLEYPAVLTHNTNGDMFVLDKHKNNLSHLNNNYIHFVKFLDNIKVQNIISENNRLYCKKINESFYTVFDLNTLQIDNNINKELFDSSLFDNLPFEFILTFKTNYWINQYKDKNKTNSNKNLALLPCLMPYKVFLHNKSLALSDSYCHHIENLSNNSNRYIWRNDSEKYKSDYLKIWNNIFISNRLVDDDFNLLELNDSKSSSSIIQQIGSWKIVTDNNKSSYNIYGISNGKETYLLSKDSIQYRVLNKPARILFKDNTNIKILFDYGFEILDNEKEPILLEEKPIHFDTYYFIRNEEDCFLGNAFQGGFNTKTGLLESIPSNAFYSLYYNKDDDWRIYYSPSLGGICFSKELKYDDNKKERITYNLKDLFYKGQFIFDHVNNVYFYPPMKALVVKTQVGFEKLHNNKLYDINRKSISQKEIDLLMPQGNSRNITSIKYGDAILYNKDNPNSLPLAFFSNNRCWVVTPSEIQYIEQASRWKNKFK